MRKRIQYTGTTEEKQPSCAFRTDFETKRYVYPLSFASLSSSPKGTPLRCARNFAATAKSRPLGEGGCDQREQTEGVPSNKKSPHHSR